MPLSNDVYKELEDILGPENLTRDPAILCGYQYPVPVVFGGSEDGLSPKPAAVALPGSTKEVQAIIKLSNRRGLKSRAFSTGYVLYNRVENEDVMILDLRRMNRIIDIDEKNMFIVVEPYVSWAQVQAEANKRGLNCHIISAGSQTSFLASHTSAHGHSSQAISHGYSGRKLLGVEWVLPTGEILNTGSFGSGAGWFSGDGPGPSLRGIIRGAGGAYGGLGVFTKCSARLNPWPGPSELDIQGRSPEYEAELPPFFTYHVIDFPDWYKYTEAVYKIGKAGIAFALHKTSGPGSHPAMVTTSNNDYYEKWMAGGLRLPKISFAMVMAAYDKRGFEYQTKVLGKILEETEGKISAVGEEETWKKRDFLHFIKICFIPRQPFRLAGGMAETLSSMETTDHIGDVLVEDEKLIEKYQKKGVIMDDGTLNNWMVTYENGHFSHYEGGILWDTSDTEAAKEVANIYHEGEEIAEKLVAHTPAFIPPGPLLKAGPAAGNYHIWMQRIKKAFDPNEVSDNTYYISAKEKK